MSTGLDIFDLAQRRLSWAGQRQALLARNVANADTPGYRPQDLTPFAHMLGRQAAAPTLSVTSPLHLAGLPPRPQGATPEAGWERAPDGNAVALDKELTKIADTEGAQELAVNLYQKYAAMFRAALGR